MTVRQCHADEVIALRHMALRPHLRPDEVAFARDSQAGTAHFCAEDDQGHIVYVATVWPEPPPWQPCTTSAWCLRGMATAPEWRRQGVGSSVLEAVLAHVTTTGGRLLWCNATLGARRFYERAGMKKTGEPLEEPFVGTLVAMFKEL